MTAEWKTSNKIIARNVAGNGKGDIIVTTVQGSRGTSTVQFKGKEKYKNIQNDNKCVIIRIVICNMSVSVVVNRLRIIYT